ncbi:MAG TPA: ester cyclase [Alphaproteobacteria bacterium]|nr:ester cyclase [Alphaproteobacteria bacterium]
MSKEENIAAVKRWGAEVANQGKFDVLDDILAPNFVDHDPAPDQGPGIEGLKGFFRAFRAAFPDLSTEVEELVASDNEIAMRYTVRGTHQGSFMGVPPTGKRFEAAALQIAKFKDGKCVERWGSTDELGILEQLGIVDRVH